MKRKRFTALKVTLTAMMLTAALTSGAGSAYAVDLSQEGGSEPTVTITPSPEITPELPLPTPTPVPKNGLLKEGKVYRYYVNNKPVRNKWKRSMVNTTGLNPMELQLMMDITRLKEFLSV